MIQEPMQLTAEEIANEIRMQLGIKKGPFILVEGFSDAKFFSERLRVDMENIVPSFGWKHLFQAISILESEGIQNVLGVIDLDYRGIVTKPKPPHNVVITDFHDLETMMLASPAFQKVLRQKASIQKVKACGRDYRSGEKCIMNRIIELGKHIGMVRLYTQLESQEYSFKKMDFEKFIDRKGMLFLEDKFISHIRGCHQNNISMPNSYVKNATSAIRKMPKCPEWWILCCGHDLMEILAIGLKSLWGTNNSRQISGRLLEESFSLAYTFDTFRNTGLFRQMDKWFSDKGYSEIWCE